MIDRQLLIERAWAQVEGALNTGIIVTEDGSQHALKAGELAALLRWVASLDSGKRKKAMELPEDLRKLMGGTSAPQASDHV